MTDDGCTTSIKRPDGRREIAGDGATAGSSSCFVSEESSVGFAADVSVTLSCGAPEAAWSSAFLAGVLISGNTTAGLVSEAACGNPLASVDGEAVSLVDDSCSEVGGSPCDSLCGLSSLDSGVVDRVGGSGIEVGDGGTGDEVVLNDGIGSSVSFETGFGAGFVTEIGTAVGAGVAAAAGGALGVFDEADDCVVLAGAGGLLVSVLVDSDAGTVAMAEVGDAGADTGVDSGAGVAVGAVVGNGGVSGLMVNGGIGVDGVVAGDGGADGAGAAGATDEDGDVSGDGGVDVGSDFSIGCGAVATGALGGVDNDTAGCGATGLG